MILRYWIYLCWLLCSPVPTCCRKRAIKHFHHRKVLLLARGTTIWFLSLYIFTGLFLICVSEILHSACTTLYLASFHTQCSVQNIDAIACGRSVLTFYCTEQGSPCGCCPVCPSVHLLTDMCIGPPVVALPSQRLFGTSVYKSFVNRASHLSWEGTSEWNCSAWGWAVV